MKTYTLTYKQSKDVVYNDKQVRLTRDGNAFYVEQIGDKIVVTNWLGKEVDYLKVQLNEWFRD